MAQLPCIGLYRPCINLCFGDRAMYFDHRVYHFLTSNLYTHENPVQICIWSRSKVPQQKYIYKNKHTNNPAPHQKKKHNTILKPVIFQVFPFVRFSFVSPWKICFWETKLRIRFVGKNTCSPRVASTFTLWPKTLLSMPAKVLQRRVFKMQRFGYAVNPWLCDLYSH